MRTTPVVLGLLLAAAAPSRAQEPVRAGQLFSVRANDAETLQSMVTVSDLSNLADKGSGWWPGGYSSSGAPVGPGLSMYQSPAGSGFDGVARLLVDFGGSTSGCTGSLLMGGRDILTAAHCVYNFSTGQYAPASAVTIGFLQAGSPTPSVVNFTGAQVIAKPGYTGAVVDPNDLAIIRLSQAADAWIPRYSLFNGNPMHQDVSFVGYGRTGNGVTGGVITTLFDATPVRRVATNSWETTRDQSYYYANEQGTPVTSILVSDFDGEDPGGTYPMEQSWDYRSASENNAICQAWESVPGLSQTMRDALCDPGAGLHEGLTGSGDSGGGAFIQQNGAYRLAAVASFGSTRCVPDQHTPVRTSGGCPSGYIRNGSYFGATAGHVSVSYGENYAWVQSQVAPEPGTMLLLGTGLLGIGRAARRRRRGAQTAADERL